MKKGITFMALVVMIAIILTLTTTAVISGVSAINNTKKIKFATELSYVQEIVNSYVNVEYNISFNKAYIVDINDASQDVKAQFNDELVSNGKVTLYEIDQDLEIFKESDLTYGKKQIGKDEQEKSSDVYLYSLNTGKVYYAKGLELNGNLYYTLTDELKEKIDYTEINNNNLSSGDVIFTKTTDDWTNSSIYCEIKIPQIYSNITVLKDGVKIEDYSETTSYFVYLISTNTNCSIQVNYVSVDGANVTKNYEVSNIDTNVPTIDVSDIKKLINTEDGSLKRYIQINSKYDNESGIKYIKYEKTSVPLDEVKSYFTNNGIVLNQDSILVPEDIENVTIYIEDNAGNYSAIIK